jgi:hypothetical protein
MNDRMLGEGRAEARGNGEISNREHREHRGLSAAKLCVLAPLREILFLVVLAVVFSGCDTVSRKNFDKITLNTSTRADVYQLFGKPEDRGLSVDMPDREVYYQNDNPGKPHVVIFYDGAEPASKVVDKQWRR